MKRWAVNRKRLLSWTAVSIVVASSSLILGFKQSDSDYFLKIGKSIDIFGRVYKEVALNYVDEVDPEKFMEAGIDGLLSTLDPYTTFINETEGDQVELITTGKYGGIGVTIGLREAKITIITVMEGYSAQRQGLQPGDHLLEIDGKPVGGLKPEGVRSLTRGEPGTELHVKIERDGEPKPLDFTLVREEIQLHNVSYADYVDDGVAYIRLERFSRTAGDELRLAIKDLKLKGTIRGMILDIRDNPGGLLDVAVDVAEKFLPKGSLVVSTRGRKPDTEKKYFVTEEPMLPDVPLVVLVNRNSASASEILAGAIQDLDRGIILGTRTFGKGLVQTITPLVYNTQLKITTAKYYTPSGRCIQEIDYAHKGKDGLFAITPDSLRKQFKTLRGRKEYELGGIQPDTSVEDQQHNTFYDELNRKSMFFRHATRYEAMHKVEPVRLDDDSLIADFRRFLDDQHFVYEDEAEVKARELKDVAQKSKYNQAILAEIDKLGKSLSEGKATDLERNRKDVLSSLKVEIASRYNGEHGRIEASLTDDVQLTAARGLLKNGKEYSRRLTMR